MPHDHPVSFCSIFLIFPPSLCVAILLSIRTNLQVLFSSLVANRNFGFFSWSIGYKEIIFAPNGTWTAERAVIDCSKVLAFLFIDFSARGSRNTILSTYNIGLWAAIFAFSESLNAVGNWVTYLKRESAALEMDRDRAEKVRATLTVHRLHRVPRAIHLGVDLIL